MWSAKRDKPRPGARSPGPQAKPGAKAGTRKVVGFLLRTLSAPLLTVRSLPRAHPVKRLARQSGWKRDVENDIYTTKRSWHLATVFPSFAPLRVTLLSRRIVQGIGYVSKLTESSIPFLSSSFRVCIPFDVLGSANILKSWILNIYIK